MTSVCMLLFSIVIMSAGLAGSIMFGVSFVNARVCNVLESDAPVWRVTPLRMFGVCTVDFSYDENRYNGTLDAACSAIDVFVSTAVVAVCYPIERPWVYDASTKASSLKVINYIQQVIVIRYVGLALAVPLWLSILFMIISMFLGCGGSLQRETEIATL